MTREETTGRRRQLLLVLGFVLLFGGLSLWAIWSMSRDAAREAEAAPFTVAEDLPTAEDARTLLLITTDKGEARGFVLVRFDPAASRLRAMAIPREAATEETGPRLFELFRTQQAPGVCRQITAMSGFPLDYYAVLSYDGLEELLSRSEERLSFFLPQNLLYEMEDYTIDIPGGQQELSATQVTDVLRYPAWNGGRREQTAMQAQVVSACINQFLTPAALEGDAGYNALVGVADTNCLREAYGESRDVLAGLAAKNTGSGCQSLSAAGRYDGTGADTRFYPEDPARPAIRAVFGAR